MEKIITLRFLSILGLVFLYSFSFAQEETLEAQLFEDLFSNQDKLHIKLAYSQKLLKKNTLDSINTVSVLSYQNKDGSWESMKIKLEARGNYRRKVCYFPPIKVKIKKSDSKGTIFKGHKKLKVVLPCQKEKQANDAVLKEYLAYKIFEVISPYHFKTRLLAIEFTEEKGKKINNFNLLGILIEDLSKLEKRYDGREIKNFVHPLEQEATTSIRNALFQYMIGNTDFSTSHQHNQKLEYINEKILPIPYDFDMCGFVDPSYGVLSKKERVDLGRHNMRERLYRGFVRDQVLMQNIRQEFIENQLVINQIMADHESFFTDPKEFLTAQKYLDGFYEVINNDKYFENEILKKARTR